MRNPDIVPGLDEDRPTIDMAIKYGDLATMLRWARTRSSKDRTFTWSRVVRALTDLVDRFGHREMLEAAAANGAFRHHIGLVRSAFPTPGSWGEVPDRLLEQIAALQYVVDDIEKEAGRG